MLFVLSVKRATIKPANRYLSIKKRRGHKKAILAITRMSLTAILKKNIPNTEPYIRSNVPPEHQTVFVEKAVFILQHQ